MIVQVVYDQCRYNFPWFNWLPFFLQFLCYIGLSQLQHLYHLMFPSASQCPEKCIKSEWRKKKRKNWMHSDFIVAATFAATNSYLLLSVHCSSGLMNPRNLSSHSEANWTSLQKYSNIKLWTKIKKKVCLMIIKLC